MLLSLALKGLHSSDYVFFSHQLLLKCKSELFYILPISRFLLKFEVLGETSAYLPLK